MEKVVNKVASKAFGHKFIICGGSVNWWDAGLHQFEKGHRACFVQGLGNDSNWNNY